jgi:hypothetical protein
MNNNLLTPNAFVLVALQQFLIAGHRREPFYYQMSSYLHR